MPTTEYKDYVIETGDAFGMKIIKPKGRGSVPLEMRGFFTSETFAKNTIDAFINKKEVKNAEAVNNA